AAKATSDDEEAAASSSLEFNEWSGPILPGMADYLRAALDTYATSSHRVVLFLDSVGGQVEEGDRVIHVLDEIKQTHHLITTVLNDKGPARSRRRRQSHIALIRDWSRAAG